MMHYVDYYAPTTVGRGIIKRALACRLSIYLSVA